MNKLFKILGRIISAIILVLVAGMIYFNTVYPKVEKPANIKVEMTPARIARGEYLAKHVAVCIDCHSTRDWSKYSGPVVEGTMGRGGQVFDEKIGIPGTIYVKNITPAALGNWEDGEIIRAITCGVNKNGEALFPIMPYMNYNQLSKEDLYSIVSYIRTLKPIKGEYPAKELNFPVNFIVKTLPVDRYKSSNSIDKNDPVNYGKYLVTTAGCADCHTPSKDGTPIKGRDFAGNSQFNLPIGILRTANITPDNETGIGSWTKEMFIARFKNFDPQNHEYVSVHKNSFNTIMPWTMYAGMTEEDLGAIYQYLRTIKPIKSKVEIFTALNN